MKQVWVRSLIVASAIANLCGDRATADDAAAAVPTKTPLTGQIVIDPEHPQWLKRHGGAHVYLCGPGDPEGFLYAGRLESDGTRNGDQVQRINKLIEHGGNCIYMQIVRSHGGDAKADGDPDWARQNPFVDGDPSQGLNENILAQWDEWFALMDQHNILIYLFFYDDGARLWNTGDDVGPEEREFFQAIVERYQHLKNLIWVVAEESEEAYSTARVQALADVIRAADEHGHLIGNHHHSGTTFKSWRPGGALNHYSMQLTKTDYEAHQGAIEALHKADGRYQVIYSESTAMRTDPAGMRTHAWAVAMGGLMPMLLRMDIVGTPVESLNQCRFLQAFFEATDFYTMSPHDELAAAETKYVLANPGRSYIAYGDDATQTLGLKDVPDGSYDVLWMDCVSGERHQTVCHVSKPPLLSVEKPAGFGPECVAWIGLRGSHDRGEGRPAAPADGRSQTRSRTPSPDRPKPNAPPKATDGKVTTTVGEDVFIQLTFQDDDGPGPYAYTLIRAPEHGKLTGDDNDRTYSPMPGFTGTDRFTWKVSDGRADSEEVTVTITVKAAAASDESAAEAYFPPPDSAGGWRQLTSPEDVRRVAGMDIAKLDDAFEYIQGSTKNGGLLVLRHGWLVYEEYFGRGHREAAPNLGSCGKSITSIAVGILMSERPDLFPDGLDQKVFTPTYFPPEEFPLSDPRKADITLGQLLAFSAGIRGNNPSFVNGEKVDIDPPGPDGWPALVDDIALGKRDYSNRQGAAVSAASLWCEPGSGYSYATASIHLASIMLRHVTGRELQEYVEERLAQPLGWGRWNFGYRYADQVKHTPGGGGIALRPTDMLRFGYLLLNDGRWNGQQLVPADYVRHCGRKSVYNPHYPYSLQFNVNSDGSVPGLPRDAFWKTGSGGHAIYVVPSLDLVVWKLGGRDGQYSQRDTGMPIHPDAAREADPRTDWRRSVDEAAARTRTLQLVIAAIAGP